MSGTDFKVLEVIWDWGGEASVDIIAREVRISIDYARVICESLKREGCIDFLYSKLSRIKSKGKVVVAEKRGQNPKKIVVPEKLSRFRLGKDKRGRLILSY